MRSKTCVQTCHRLVFGTVNADRLDAFRRVYIGTFLIYVAWLVPYAPEWLSASGFHYTSETCHPALPVPLPTLPECYLPAFVILVFACGSHVVFRRFDSLGRIAICYLLAAAVYIQAVDSIAASSMNKHYVVVFALFTILPPVFEQTHQGKRLRVQSVWPIRILQATLVSLYFTAGTSKILHGDWWSDPDVLWTQIQGIYRTEFAAWALHTFPRSAWSGLMYLTLGFEILAPLLLLIKRLRPIGIAAGILFHLGIGLMMKDLMYFGLEMIAFYVLLLNDQQLRFLVSWIRRPAPWSAPDGALLGSA